MNVVEQVFAGFFVLPFCMHFVVSFFGAFGYFVLHFAHFLLEAVEDWLFARTRFASSIHRVIYFGLFSESYMFNSAFWMRVFG